jgi:hypothetical protein
VLDLEKGKLTLFKRKDLEKELPGFKDFGLDLQWEINWRVPDFNDMRWSADGKTLEGSTDHPLLFKFSPDGRIFERIWPDSHKVPFITTEQFDVPSAPLEKDTLGAVGAKFVPVPSVAKDVPPQSRELPVQVIEVKE